MVVQTTRKTVYVSGTGADGSSQVIAQRTMGDVTPIDGMPTVLHEDLYADEAAADLSAGVSIPPAGTFTVPSRGGHVLRLLDFLPDPPGYDVESGRHSTPTIDHVIVLEGELTCEFDVGHITLRAGDVLVQRGAEHAWSNKSGKPCRVLAVIIDALPGA